MDIIIKSFNRPFYLERCIRSILKFIKGKYRIIILDDGTPPEYLQKITGLFPGVVIRTSPLYYSKVEAIRSHVSIGKKYDLFSIPTDFWRTEISRCSDFFLLLEDDIWLTDEIDISEFESLMKAKNIVSLKLSWLGNDRLVNGTKSPLNSSLQEVVPSIPLLSKVLFTNKFYSKDILKILDKLKISPLLYSLRIIKGEFDSHLSYYTFYTVASAFFYKPYWSYLWEGASDKVDEMHQLRKATLWSMKKNQSRFAKTVNEVAKTSFITSTTNSFDDVNLDLFTLNHKLNEAWLFDKLDVMQNFPSDFDVNYLAKFIKGNVEERIYLEWEKWIKRFKEQYQLIGCAVD